VITTVRSVKTETDRGGRATVRVVVAALRPCVEKTTATRASRAVEVRAAEEVRGSEVIVVEWFAWLEMTRQRRRRAVELWWWRKQRKRKTRRRRCSVFIGRRTRPQGDARHVANTPKQKMAVEGAPGSSSKLAGVGREMAPCRWLEVD
jgi:hypothetical protein